MEKQVGRKKTLQGVVVSVTNDKTIVVRVNRRLRHPVYGKFVNRSKKFMAHDEGNVCKMGDEVRIIESRPLSRRKRWRLVEVLKHSVEA
ncbi:MAG TPA: 30S ribosomal protein S17 [Candidatus Marinimicrobia bacterium]|nr:MAG: 30S ribosomal protein S17 [Candidatus Marinimicrobia bacterium CG1_02_48_14]PIZ69379.1 MAG: 30S ribosomal protein S17 [Candidatus Marinimicrobia bacterium CG_4_10_14_0_2_um_filter_48_9]PJA54081.1 MAG: 30S ribosomal protein S17 [Candidatus Marinimicrobia bacterium CG_4_9_14_3_um_filter_48_9]HCW75801.1 30S ribosomal protein S17 [Candidatus Neomarinimicrobiota bacterium]